MAFHRFTIIRLSRSLLALLICLQVVACNSSSEEGANKTPVLIPSLIPALNWIAPSEREDGTPISLAEIAGYRVYYGSSTGEYLNKVDITGSTANQAELSGLLPGTYYFVVTVFDTDGRESRFSEEVRITI